MGDIGTETGSRDGDLYARLDELELMVRRLMGGVSIPSAAGASFQPLAAAHHHSGHAHLETAPSTYFGSLAHPPVDGRPRDPSPRGLDSGQPQLVRTPLR